MCVFMLCASLWDGPRAREEKPKDALRESSHDFVDLVFRVATDGRIIRQSRSIRNRSRVSDRCRRISLRALLALTDFVARLPEGRNIFSHE